MRPCFCITLLSIHCMDVHCFYLSYEGVLKDYLRELPSPLITKQLYEAVLDAMVKTPLKMTANGCENDPSDSEDTVALLDCLPDVEKVSIIGDPLLMVSIMLNLKLLFFKKIAFICHFCSLSIKTLGYMNFIIGWKILVGWSYSPLMNPIPSGVAGYDSVKMVATISCDPAATRSLGRRGFPLPQSKDTEHVIRVLESVLAVRLNSLLCQSLPTLSSSPCKLILPHGGTTLSWEFLSDLLLVLRSHSNWVLSWFRPSILSRCTPIVSTGAQRWYEGRIGLGHNYFISLLLGVLNIN